MGTFVFYELFGCHPGFLFGFQFFCSWLLAFLGLWSVCHGYKDTFAIYIFYLFALPLKKLLLRVLLKWAGGPLAEGQTLAVILSLLFMAVVVQCHAQTLPVAGDLAKTGIVDDISANTWLYFSKDVALS